MTATALLERRTATVSVTSLNWVANETACNYNAMLPTATTHASTLRTVTTATAFA